MMTDLLLDNKCSAIMGLCSELLKNRTFIYNFEVIPSDETFFQNTSSNVNINKEKIENQSDFQLLCLSVFVVIAE